jgi:ATP-binding cassette subfamily A (ABC1) protein 3
LAELLGVEEVKITSYVNEIIERFALSDFADTVAAVLSGGNKRKLTLAVAMMGRPKIIYIDEASTGVDPLSRRQLWKAIRYEGKDSAVIMTTHAMEEAEALCQRLGVMVSGKFKCLGTL